MFISEAFCTKILRSVNEGIVIINELGKIVWVNQRLEEMFGYAQDELCQQELEILVGQKSKGTHKKLTKRFFNSPAKRHFTEHREFEGQKKDGSPIWIKIELDFHQDENGLFAIAIISDKTEKRYDDIISAEHARRAALFFNLSKALFLELDKKGNVILINNEGLKILECTKNQIIGKNWFDSFISSEDVDEVKNIFKDLIAGKQSQKEFINSHVITKSGKTKLIQWHNSVVKDDNNVPVGTISSGVDVTAIEQLKEKQGEAMLIGMEKERKRVAIELHDGIVQTLSAISMYLKSMEDNIQLLSEENQSAFNEALKLTIETIADIRSISRDLMPNTLIKDGLVAALDDLAKRTTKYNGISVFIDPDHINDGLAETDRLNLYRIIQELIHNTIKHAEADTINIIINKSPGIITINFADNGKGFTKSLDESMRLGLGLQNIMTRVGSMNGAVSFKSTSKEGTTVNISIPVNY